MNGLAEYRTASQIASAAGCSATWVNILIKKGELEKYLHIFSSKNRVIHISAIDYIKNRPVNHGKRGDWLKDIAKERSER